MNSILFLCFRCPVKECDVIKKDRLNLALHYGMDHKVNLLLSNAVF
jgi:hypothetical protein